MLYWIMIKVYLLISYCPRGGHKRINADKCKLDIIENICPEWNDTPCRIEYSSNGKCTIYGYTMNRGTISGNFRTSSFKVCKGDGTISIPDHGADAMFEAFGKKIFVHTNGFYVCAYTPEEDGTSRLSYRIFNKQDGQMDCYLSSNRRFFLFPMRGTISYISMDSEGLPTEKKTLLDCGIQVKLLFSLANGQTINLVYNGEVRTLRVDFSGATPKILDDSLPFLPLFDPSETLTAFTSRGRYTCVSTSNSSKSAIYTLYKSNPLPVVSIPASSIFTSLHVIGERGG